MARIFLIAETGQMGLVCKAGIFNNLTVFVVCNILTTSIRHGDQVRLKECQLWPSYRRESMYFWYVELNLKKKLESLKRRRMPRSKE